VATSSDAGTSSLIPNDDQLQQRVERSPRYSFGLGKRRYMITTGGPGKKRLPHYNFGLGKRASPYQQYSFGLGKRDDEPNNYDDESDNYFGDNNNFDKGLYNLNMENWENGANLENKNDIDIDYDVLGLRPGEEKRARYSFGLGKRRYDFGLGKRKYSDELDKRLPNRYNFGLGR
jgi:hypothetical protein